MNDLEKVLIFFKIFRRYKHNYNTINTITGCSRKLDWPAKSPDLNPIENFWTLIKAMLRQKNQHHDIKQEWNSLTFIEYAKKFADSCLQRFGQQRRSDPQLNICSKLHLLYKKK